MRKQLVEMLEGHKEEMIQNCRYLHEYSSEFLYGGEFDKADRS